MLSRPLALSLPLIGVLTALASLPLASAGPAVADFCLNRWTT
jgi:hypothetical protein